ncbi:MAG: hypothetical protein R6U27_08210, partial [Desulfobacterales bacterium]
STGVPNEMILSNLKKIRQEKKDLNCVIRIPLIPGFNDDEENVSKTAEFVNSLGIKQIDLLPFNDQDDIILINQSGRGDKDIFTIADAFGDPKWRQFIIEKAKKYNA